MELIKEIKTANVRSLNCFMPKVYEPSGQTAIRLPRMDWVIFSISVLNEIFEKVFKVP